MKNDLRAFDELHDLARAMDKASDIGELQEAVIAAAKYFEVPRTPEAAIVGELLNALASALGDIIIDVVQPPG